MEKLEGRIECKVSKTEAKSADKWRICERCSFQLGRNEDWAYSKCNRCAKGCHVAIIEKQGGPTSFLSSNTSCKTWTCDLFKFRKWQRISNGLKPSHFMILRIVQSGHVNYPFFEIGHFVLCLALLRLNKSPHGTEAIKRLLPQSVFDFLSSK